MKKKRSRAKTAAKAKGPWLKRYWWKLCLTFSAILGSYLFYLDIQIQERFSGNKWQVPAQVYARPMLLKTGADLTRTQLLQELKLLGYRKVKRVGGSGQYHLGKDGIRIHRRGFEFAGGRQQEQYFLLRLSANKVQEIISLPSQKPLRQIYLEPWLLTRLSTGDIEDRMLVTLDEVPDALVQALLLTEDRNFYNHYGIAPIAILRALVANISAGRTVQGGSTLTQQLVKNLFLTREKSLWRKANEALMALILELRYSKAQILQAYLNEVFLGQNGRQAVHGFGLASWFYFDRPIDELNLAEAATLVAMVKGASYYHPRRHPERTKERRDLILRLLFEHQHISSGEYQQLVASQLGVVPKNQLREGKYPAFMQLVQRELKQRLPDKTQVQAGIKVYTTLDPNAQKQAEKAVSGSLTRIEKQRPKASQLNAAFIASDIKTGEIRALVGDRNARVHGFNRALDARRPIGSVVKPAVYLTALAQPQRYNLATPLKDEPIKLKSSYGKQWQPQNVDNTFLGRLPLISALSQSRNVPTVTLGMTVGLENIADTIGKLGVSRSIKTVPAMTLGAVELSPFEVNQMYQTIANEGFYRPLHAVQAITRFDNEILWQHNTQGEQNFDPKVMYLLNYALHKVTREGTAKALYRQFPDHYFAGKTGTTNDYRDSWFSGFDRQMLVTAWVGRDDNKPTTLTGSSGALRIYSDFQTQRDPISLSRHFPQGLGIAHFDPETGARVTPGCRGSLSLPAIMAHLPKQPKACQSAPAVAPAPEAEPEKSFWDRFFGR